ncbi:hypothetical protein KMC57_gp32 [Achromobacter phage vB_AxyP_19-32_Axy24]|uniref:Uncharacterized protein n=1 Tax=Achromobacter phage vB_AxyP_19-32_Axy24 TaxID=2591048 RepID=A0A514CWA3_9CAUD|nr:hypothetical protein KMC57_gp32 [Achromobacter phage vB_AxyP_19-32_Axy24]QDH84767.1 hypothetical protein Axy24_032 [Achromobacter phage vB_AxyP_19-32_Axy24]
MENGIWYRYEDRVESVGGYDLDGEYRQTGSKVVLQCLQFRVLRYTPKGVWLTHCFGNERFVLRGTRKQFAHPTKAEALDSFIHRKDRQAAILSSRLRNAEVAKEKAIHQLKIEDPTWQSI